MLTGYEKIGRKAPTLPECFRRAAASVFADEVSKQARKSLSSKVKKRESQQISRPRGTNTKGGTKVSALDALAVKNPKVAAFLKHDEEEADF